MNGKDKKPQNPLKAESAGEQNFPVVTTWAMLVSGILLVALLGFVHEDWWLRLDSPIKEAKGPLLALVSASVAMATVLLTTNYQDNKHRIWAYLITGLVAWVAVFSTVPESIPVASYDGLVVALFMLLAMTPLFIAFIGPWNPKIPVKGVPLYLLIGGVAMVALSLVLATTRAGLALESLGITAPESVIALLGVSGMVLVLVVSLWRAAKPSG